MSFTHCPTCLNEQTWEWDDAFDKFGFDDGDGLVMTDHVADALRTHGYVVTVEPWGIHNVTIASIKTEAGDEVIPFDDINFGYDDARDYLPKHIVDLLDAAFPDGGEVEL